MNWKLTTDHPASSYGIPVVECGGGAYGPKEFIGLIRVAEIVKKWAEEPGKTTNEIAMAGKFLRTWPEGPQLKHVPGVRGRPKQFGKTSVFSVRLPDELLNKLPKIKSDRTKFVRDAIRERIEKSGK